LFDPFFALAFLFIAFALVGGVTYLVCRVFFSHGIAKTMAWAIPVPSLIGFFGSLNLIDYAMPLTLMEMSPALRVASGVPGAFLLSIIVGFIVRWKFKR
jgi:hypothetical protein